PGPARCGTPARRATCITNHGPCRVAAPATRRSTTSGDVMAIKNVGVIGCGLMGGGIVQVAAQAGCQVLFVEASDELVGRGLGRLRATLEGLVAKSKLEAKAKDETLARIAGTTRLDDLKSCDLVVEA